MHRWDAQLGTRDFKGAEVIGCDKAEGGYFTRMFDNAGHHPDYRASVEGDVWSFTEAQTRATVTVDRGGNRMTFNWEWKNDGKKWLPLCDRVAVKTSQDKATDTTGIREVATVFVPVANQELALAYYVDKFGFEKRVDLAYGNGQRWIEVAPPGATNAIALVPKSEGDVASNDRAHCALATDNINAEHARLLKRGVAVDEQIAEKGTSRAGLNCLSISIANPQPRQFFLRDLDGNRFLIVEAA